MVMSNMGAEVRDEMRIRMDEGWKMGARTQGQKWRAVWANASEELTMGGNDVCKKIKE